MTRLEDAARAALDWISQSCWPDGAQYAGEGHGMSMTSEDVRRVVRVRDALRAALASPEPSLDAAWAAAEAALPEGWHIRGLRWLTGKAEWMATAEHFDGLPRLQLTGPTPAAALLELAERLKENA